MKKVGILTRHVYPNYGSLLQSYALEHALASLGAAARVIDYFPTTDRPFKLAGSRLKESRVRDSAVKSAAYLMIQTPNMATMSLRFRKFQREYLTLTRTCADDRSVLDVADDLDLVITGSDQVWNSIHGQLDPVYFLNGQKPDKKHIKRGGKVWINVYPDRPLTKKPAETRMGSGKGSPALWIARRIASRATSSGTPDSSNMTRPGLTLATHHSGEPLPEPMRVSAGLLVRGRSGEMLIHTLPPRLM